VPSTDAVFALLLPFVASAADAPRLRFDGGVRGCGDATVVAEGGAEFLTVGLSRSRLSLKKTPTTFRIEDAPAGLEVLLFVYAKRPSYTEHCTDLAPPADVARTVWKARRGRVTVALSKAAPKPLECYEVDLHLEDVAFTDGSREVVLRELRLAPVRVGDLPPLGCTP